MANDLQQLMSIEKPVHLNYLRDFRVEQCQLFLQHKCTQHRPFSCFYWHFQNQRRRRPARRVDGTFSYDPDFYCNDYDEQTGLCPKGDDCLLLHRNANDTEKRYHLRYYKTGICTHETDIKGHCQKNGIHCSYAHGANDLRQPILDIREIQISDLAIERLTKLCISLENERALNDDPKWNDSHYVLANYKTEPCKRPPRLCRQGYACPQYHNPRDRRRNPSIFKYKSTPCPHVKQNDEWIDPTVCEVGDSCKYCHTRTEQQFHPEIYKSTKCNDVSVTIYCPRGPFCAFAHIEQELKSYRDFDLHYPSDFPLASFIPIPEEKEVGPSEKMSPARGTPKKSSSHDTNSLSSFNLKKNESKTSEKMTSSTNPLGNSSSNLKEFPVPTPPLYLSSQQNQYFQSNSLASSVFLNDPLLLAAAAAAHDASHSYPPPSAYLSSIATSNFLSSINAHFHTISPSSQNDLDQRKDQQDNPSLTADVKNLIGSSLTAIGFGQVDDIDFDRASNNDNNSDTPKIDPSNDKFDRSVTPVTDNTSPTQFMATSSTLTRPMNIPHSFSGDHFSYSSSAKSPFDGPNALLGETLESPIDTPFPETSTSSGNSSRPGELYIMAGFSQDLPVVSHPLQDASPKSFFQLFNANVNNPVSVSSSSSEIEAMRNRVMHMQALAMNEKEACEQWRREVEENHRLVFQLEQEKLLALKQRDEALRRIDQMHQLLVHKMCFVPNENDLMHLSLDEIHSLKARIQEDLAKLSLIEKLRGSNAGPLRPSPSNLTSTPIASSNTNSSTHSRHHKHHRNKHELVSSNTKQ